MSNASQSDLNQLFHQCIKSLNQYETHLENEAKNDPTETTPNESVVDNLLNLLEDTRNELERQLVKDRVVRVDSKTLKLMELTLRRILDPKVGNRINAIHFSLYGAMTPFWNTLKALHQLVHTVESIRNGKPISSFD